MTFTVDGNGKNYLSDDLLFKRGNTCKAAGCGPWRLERMGSMKAAIL